MKSADKRPLIVKIKIAQKELGLEDDVYRALLMRVTGKDSCTKLSYIELGKVLAELQRQGWQNKRDFGQRPNRRQSADAMLNKIEALLAEMQLHWNYAHALAKGMYHCDRVEWLSDEKLHGVVAALQIHANRKKKQRVVNDEN